VIDIEIKSNLNSCGWW